MKIFLVYFISSIFGLAIFGKLTGKTTATFDKAGYSRNFMYALALAELILTLGLFTHYALYSIIGLTVIMLGAILTLFRQQAKPPHYILSIVALSALLTLCWLEYPLC